MIEPLDSPYSAQRENDMALTMSKLWGKQFGPVWLSSHGARWAARLHVDEGIPLETAVAIVVVPDIIAQVLSGLGPATRPTAEFERAIDDALPNGLKATVHSGSGLICVACADAPATCPVCGVRAITTITLLRPAKMELREDA